MKLEIGKHYLTRDGQITGPLTKNEFDPLGAFPFMSDGDNRRHFHTKSGGHYALGNISKHDLVAEYAEPPYPETSNESCDPFPVRFGVRLDAARVPYPEPDGAYIHHLEEKIPGDPETDLREAIGVIRKQHAEIQAYRTILKQLL